MLVLIFVSFVWAASFGLMRTFLVGVNPDLVNAVRLALAMLVFLPFLRRRQVGWRRALELMAVGAVQFGAMYALYTRSYASLKAHQVALATVLTPLYVSLLDDLLERRLRLRFLACAALAVAGTWWIIIGPGSFGSAPAHGLVLVQVANVCFAVGQVWYRRVMARAPGLSNRGAFAWCAVGAAVVALAAAAPAWAAGAGHSLTGKQLAVLVYLGAVASGLCFFLWNVGARQVNTGVLAVMNELKVPLGVLVSLVIFGEHAAWERLAPGTAVIVLALWLATRERAGARGAPPVRPRAAAGGA